MANAARLSALGMAVELSTELVRQMHNSAPTATERGGVLQQAAQPDVTAAPTDDDFNALLAKLRAAGVLAT